jgi:uncharacterized membrane protein
MFTLLIRRYFTARICLTHLPRRGSLSHLLAMAHLARALLLGITVLAASCGGASAADPSKIGDGAVTTIDGVIDDTAKAASGCPTSLSTPSFTRDVKPYLDVHCNGCHSAHPRDGGLAPSAQYFENYSAFKPWAQEALNSLRQGTMPPPETDAPSPPADICMIEAWIDQGTKDD